VLRCFLRLPLSNLVVPFLAQCYKRRKLLRHISVYRGVLHLFGQSRLQGISKSRRIPIQIGSYDLKLSIILRELSVLLLNLSHDPFRGGYSVWVSKSCFQELYKRCQVAQIYFPVLPDVWQDLAQGKAAQAVECVPHLRLFVGKAVGFVSDYHPELCDPASQMSSIRS